MGAKNKTNWRKHFFNWHQWSGILFTIPLILVSLTAILIAHQKKLGTKEIFVNIGWLPHYESEENIKHYLNDVKDVVMDSNKTYYASKLGVIIRENKNLSILKGTEVKEIRDLQLIDNQLWIASKKGLFVFEKNAVKLILNGDFHGVSNYKNVLIASEGKNGFHTSLNSGTTWMASNVSIEIDPNDLTAFTSLMNKENLLNELTLEKLMLDIHTGKAFFGEDSMWVWIDLLGISILFMSLTGIWMWYKRKFRKKNKKTMLK